MNYTLMTIELLELGQCIDFFFAANKLDNNCVQKS
jgi:hypothetical protein